MKYFKMSEFACKCGCGESNMNSTLLKMLDMARGMANVPFVITSGYRCEKHNKAIGGSETSSHTKGLAVDIRTSTSSERHAILRYVIMAGATRIGIAKDFIHVDIDSSKPDELIWLY